MSSALQANRFAPRDASGSFKKAPRIEERLPVAISRDGIVYNLSRDPANWSMYRMVSKTEAREQELEAEEASERVMARSSTFRKHQREGSSSPARPWHASQSPQRQPRRTRSQATGSQASLQSQVARLERTVGELQASLELKAPSHSDRERPEDSVSEEILRKVQQVQESHRLNVETIMRLQREKRAAERKLAQVSSELGREVPGSPATSRPRSVSPSSHQRHVSSSRAKRPQTAGAWRRSRGRFSRRASMPLTVPQPFRSMELHAAARLSKEKQRKEDEIRRKQEELEAHNEDRERFLRSLTYGKAFTGVLKRSQEMLDRKLAKQEQKRREEEAEAATCEFKAKAVHIADEDWKTIQDRQQIRRKQRVELRKAQLLRMARMPGRMAAHQIAQAQKSEPSSARGSVGSAGSSKKPKQSLPPEKVRLVLERKQRQWAAQLAARKRANKPTIPVKMALEEREQIYRRKAEEKAVKKREKEEQQQRLKEEAEKAAREKAFSAPVPSVPRTTYSQMLKAKAVEEKLERERGAEARLSARERMRKSREKEYSKTVAAAVDQMEKERRGDEYLDAPDPRDLAREANKRFRKSMKENKKRLEEAAENRPTLWERHDEGVRKEAAKRAALGAIANALSEKGKAKGKGKATGKDVMAAGLEGLFDDEEKCLLGIYDKEQ